MEKRRVTMIDVARAANVTPQTVSRAFRNDASDISEETRDRILKIAAELNYVKNNVASGLRRGSSRLIGVVYDNLKNVYFSIMIDYLQKHLTSLGYTMLAISVRDTCLGRSAYEFALSHNVDGIVSFLEPRAEIDGLIKNYGIPVLLFGRRTDVGNIDCIFMDDVKGGECAAARLAECGCKRLGCLTESLDIVCAYDRFNGFAQGAKAHGLAAPVLIDAEPRTLGERIAKHFSGENALDGLFCFNDMLAFEALYHLERNGVKGVRVVGYDNVQNEIHIPNRLTTVGTDKRSMAERTAEMIVRRVENRNEERMFEKRDVFLVEGTTA